MIYYFLIGGLLFLIGLMVVTAFLSRLFAWAKRNDPEYEYDPYGDVPYDDYDDPEF
jgi:hypothetical protein